MPKADTDRNLLFGVLALQAGLLDSRTFAEACSAWAARKDTSLADLLVEKGYLTRQQHLVVGQLLELALAKHGGDAHASLVAIVGEPARQTLLEVADPVIQQTLTPPPDSNGHPPPSTLAYAAQTRERYALARLHAEGGIGRVWVARDENLGREVALKELRPTSAAHPTLRARFVEEAKVTGQLQHPSIVPVYELSERGTDRMPFYTMRLIKGRTLGDAIKAYHVRRQAGTASPLEFRELLGNLVSVCNAVAYAHSRGVLHRDLKPGNIILGDYGETVVLDWGLAKLKGAASSPSTLPPVALDRENCRGETLQGMVLGTPGYMAKEQAEGRIDLIDERTDVYGLGAVLYHILTDSPPFTGSGTQEILAKVVQGNVTPPRQLVASTPSPLQAICLKALASQPEQRYASARELGEDTQNWLADEPVRAYPEPWHANARRWLGRHRTLTASSAVAMVLLTFGSLLFSVVLAAANERERGAKSLALRREAEATEQRRLAVEQKALADSQRERAEQAADVIWRARSKAVSQRRLAEGYLKQVEDLATSSVSLTEKLFGTDHPASANSLLNLASVYVAKGNYARAEPLIRRAAAVRSRALGSDHPDAAAAKVQLGILLHKTGNYKDAIVCFESASSTYEKVGGQIHPNYLRCIAYLGLVYVDMGNYRAAESCLSKVASGLSGATWNVDPLHYACVISQAEAAVRLGETEKAIAVLTTLDGSNLSGDLFYRLAHTYALCSAQSLKDNTIVPERRKVLAEEAARRSVVALNGAVSEDYYVDKGRLMENANFSRIRDRADFKRLLDSLDGMDAKPNMIGD